MFKLLAYSLLFIFSLQLVVCNTTHNHKLYSEKTSELPSEELPTDHSDKELEEESSKHIIASYFDLKKKPLSVSQSLRIKHSHKTIYLEQPDEPPELIL